MASQAKQTSDFNHRVIKAVTKVPTVNFATLACVEIQ